MINKRKVAGIKGAIEKWVARNSFIYVEYGNWYVGITGNPSSRKSDHNTANFLGVRRWKVWDAGSLQNARAIEEYFGANGKGMDGGRVTGGVTTKSRYIYVYK